MLEGIGNKVRDLFGGFTLRRTNPQDGIAVSYFVHFNEAYSDITYYYVRTKDGREALYLYPGYRFLVGVNFLDKKSLETLPKKTYESEREFKKIEPTEGFFLELRRQYLKECDDRIGRNKYKKGFTYLKSYGRKTTEQDLEAYLALFAAVKRTCDNLGVNYETDPEKIIGRKLAIAESADEYGLSNVTVCSSRESIDEYYKTNILECGDPKMIAGQVQNMMLLRMEFVGSNIVPFLTHAASLLYALDDHNYPNRSEILKNYMEFFISKDLVFDLVAHLDELLSNADSISMGRQAEAFDNNLEFVGAIQRMIEHNPKAETYRYHATLGEDEAKRILSEGFYLYSRDLDSTSYPEFDIDQLLAYGYGNDMSMNGDCIVVISEPTGEDIVEKLTDAERDGIFIVPRRNYMVGVKPTHKVDRKHIVGFIDKERETVTFNEYYSRGTKMM